MSCRRRDRLRTEVLSIYAAWQQQGSAALLAAMTAAAQAGAYGAEYLTTLLTPQDPPPATTSVSLLFALPGVPAQTEIDRQLSDYEVYVEGGSATEANEAREVVG